MQDNNKIVELVSKYLNSELNATELRELEDWKNADEGNRKWFDKVVEEKYLFEEVRDTARWEEEIWKKVEGKSGRVISLNWKKIFVAAAVSLVFGVGAFFMLSEKDEKVVVKNEEKSLENDIEAPESNRAVITLDNGRKIYLDSVGNGVLLEKGDINIAKLSDGRITYKSGNGGNAAEPVYNTVNNPRGSRVIDIMLEDGSRVWLNNETVLKFPMVFDNKERVVELLGEAYFEIAKDSKRKFVVKTNSSSIEVLGTDFNINAYPETGKIITSLVHGSIKAINRKKEALIKPGQQVSMDEDVIDFINNADFYAALAWKTGYIVCDHTDFSVILKQVSRWYDVDIKVRGDLAVPQTIGEIPRSLSLDQVLKILTLNTKVKFSVEGNVVSVEQ